MIKEKKICPSSSSVGSPILLVPKPNIQELGQCVDYRHHTDHSKKDKTPLLIMDELCRKWRDWEYVIKIDLKARYYLMHMDLGQAEFTVYRTKFGL
jgi:hypothetical protein